MFSYFLMKGMEEKPGQSDWGRFGEDVIQQSSGTADYRRIGYWCRFSEPDAEKIHD